MLLSKSSNVRWHLAKCQNFFFFFNIGRKEYKVDIKTSGWSNVYYWFTSIDYFKNYSFSFKAQSVTFIKTGWSYIYWPQRSSFDINKSSNWLAQSHVQRANYISEMNRLGRESWNKSLIFQTEDILRPMFDPQSLCCALKLINMRATIIHDWHK